MRQRLCFTIALALILTTLVGASAGDSDDKQAEIEKEMQALKGVWRLDKKVRNGQAQEDGSSDWRMRLTSYGQFSISDKDGLHGRGFFSINLTQEPKAIDLTHTYGDWKGGWTFGIYKLEGDTLTICWPEFFTSGERPLRFTAEAGSGRALIICKRENDEK